MRLPGLAPRRSKAEAKAAALRNASLGGYALIPALRFVQETVWPVFLFNRFDEQLVESTEIAGSHIP